MTATDETLVSQAVSLGDSAAFAELMQRHQSRILLLQRRLCGEHALAEDLSQETFLRAWQKLDTYQGSGSFGGWLAKLSFNIFRQHYRRHRRRQDEVSLDQVELSARDRDDAELADLDRLLGILDQQDQIIMTLNYAFGLTNAEVGEVVGMPAGTVKARIHRGKAKIRQHIDSPGTVSTSTVSTSTGVAGSSTVSSQPSHAGHDHESATRSPASTAATPPTPPPGQKPRAGFIRQLTGAYRL